MNLITRLFGSKTANQSVATIDANTVPPTDLFVDKTPPSSQDNISEKRSIVSDFINLDFHNAGARDGYNFHSTEILESRKKEIRSQFLFELEKAIAEKKTKHLGLRNLLIDISAISDDTSNKLKNTIDEIEESIDTLTLQKELSGMDEGWVMGPIRKYHLGFLQGMNDYVETEALLGSTSIF